jgi:hypothetical protein
MIVSATTVSSNTDFASVVAYDKAYTEYNWYPGALAPIYTALLENK